MNCKEKRRKKERMNESIIVRLRIIENNNNIMNAYQIDLHRIVDKNIANDRNNADMKDMIQK